MEDDLTFSQIIAGLSAPIATTTADGRIELANRQFLYYLGMSLEELKEWETSGVVHPDDLPRVVAAWNHSLERGEPYEVEQRIRHADGSYQWVYVRGLPLRDPRGRIVRWCVLLTDIARRKRAEALLDGEKRLLEMVASRCPFEDVLEAMCGLVDSVVGNSVCSILLIDATGTFRHGAGPTLPPGYECTVNGAPVLCEAGPCGTAASLKEQVSVPDLASDPRWVGLGWRTLVLEHGLRSVCSTPIVSSTGTVLGTFAIYQREPGPPSAGDTVGTVHDMRFVFVDNDTKLLFATAYDGDFDPYIEDFATKIPNAMDLWLCNFEGYPGMRNPSSAADWIAKHQIAAEAWYVNSPNLTGAETRRLERIGKALDEFLDKVSQ